MTHKDMLTFIEDVMGVPYTSFKESGKLVRVGQNLGGWFQVIDEGPANPALNFITSQAVGLKTRSAFPDFISLWAFLVSKDPSLPIDAEPPDDN